MEDKTLAGFAKGVGCLVILFPFLFASVLIWSLIEIVLWLTSK